MGWGDPIRRSTSRSPIRRARSRSPIRRSSSRNRGEARSRSPPETKTESRWDMIPPRSEHRGAIYPIAPPEQQIIWCKQMAGDAETILTLFSRCGDGFAPRTLATAVHRVGKFGGPCVRGDRRLPPLAEVCMRQIDAFSPQELANTAWGYAKIGFVHRRLFAAIAPVALRKIREFNSLEMANIMWAFVTLGLMARTLFDAIAVEATRHDSNPSNLTNTIRSFAKAGLVPPTLFEAIAVEAVRQIGDYNSQDMVNTMWAFASVGWQQNEIFWRLGSALNKKCSFAELNDISKSNLYLVTLYVQIEWPDLDFPLSSSQIQSLRSHYLHSRSDKRTKLRRDVSTMLTEIGWNHSVDYVTQDGLCPDLADPEAKTAIEVDGPFHYLQDVTTGECVINGSKQLKSRLLTGRGWHVIHVPFFEWEGMTIPQRRRLLTEKLAGVKIPQRQRNVVAAKAPSSSSDKKRKAPAQSCWDLL